MDPARRVIFVFIGMALPLLLTFGDERFAAAPVEPQATPRVQKAGALPEQLDGLIATTHAVCRWAEQPPVLDGKLDDRCWQQAAVIDRFGAYWADPKKAHPGMFAYLVWDDDALYYAGSMTDAELRSFGTKRNDTLWNGDVFELFLKPSADQPGYFEFQANPRALVFEMAFPKRGQYPRDYSAAPQMGNKAVVQLKGTLDQPGDRDVGWTVEGRIPWSGFAPLAGKPKPGDQWLFAICRYDYGPAGTEPTKMSSAPLTKEEFHRHEDYGQLRFEGPLPKAQPPGNR
jgi:hypothetical protein